MWNICLMQGILLDTRGEFILLCAWLLVPAWDQPKGRRKGAGMSVGIGIRHHPPPLCPLRLLFCNRFVAGAGALSGDDVILFTRRLRMSMAAVWRSLPFLSEVYPHTTKTGAKLPKQHHAIQIRMIFVCLRKSQTIQTIMDR